MVPFHRLGSHGDVQAGDRTDFAYSINIKDFVDELKLLDPLRNQHDLLDEACRALRNSFKRFIVEKATHSMKIRKNSTKFP